MWSCHGGYAGFHFKHCISWFHIYTASAHPTREGKCMHHKWQPAHNLQPSIRGRPGFPPLIYTVTIWDFTESSHKLNKDLWFKVSSDWLLTVSKLPLCMSSMGGRKRSARVLSFLSTVPPLRSSCSWRTGKRKTFIVITGNKDTVGKGWDREKRWQVVLLVLITQH